MGRIEISDINIPFLDKPRKLRIYFPEKYDTEKTMRFPVLYMQDAQNIFVNEGAFGGCSWGVKETMEQMESGGRTDGILVVGIDNDGSRRFEDYSPWESAAEVRQILGKQAGGEGIQYAEFFADTLKPYIDQTYRTLPDAVHTAVAGSSMGGLISAYIKIKYPEKFSKLGAFSTASWFAGREFEHFLETASYPENQKYYIQVGTNETVNPDIDYMPQLFLDTTLQMSRKMLQHGADVNEIKLVIGAGDTHSECSWNRHMEDFLGFIFEL